MEDFFINVKNDIDTNWYYYIFNYHYNALYTVR